MSWDFFRRRDEWNGSELEGVEEWPLLRDLQQETELANRLPRRRRRVRVIKPRHRQRLIAVEEALPVVRIVFSPQSRP